MTEHNPAPVAQDENAVDAARTPHAAAGDEAPSLSPAPIKRRKRTSIAHKQAMHEAYFAAPVTLPRVSFLEDADD